MEILPKNSGTWEPLLFDGQQERHLAHKKPALFIQKGSPPE